MANLFENPEIQYPSQKFIQTLARYEYFKRHSAKRIHDRLSRFIRDLRYEDRKDLPKCTLPAGEMEVSLIRQSSNESATDGQLTPSPPMDSSPSGSESSWDSLGLYAAEDDPRMGSPDIKKRRYHDEYPLDVIRRFFANFEEKEGNVVDVRKPGYMMFLMHGEKDLTRTFGYICYKLIVTIGYRQIKMECYSNTTADQLLKLEFWMTNKKEYSLMWFNGRVRRIHNYYEIVAAKAFKILTMAQCAKFDELIFKIGKNGRFDRDLQPRRGFEEKVRAMFRDRRCKIRTRHFYFETLVHENDYDDPIDGDYNNFIWKFLAVEYIKTVEFSRFDSGNFRTQNTLGSLYDWPQWQYCEELTMNDGLFPLNNPELCGALFSFNIVRLRIENMNEFQTLIDGIDFNMPRMNRPEHAFHVQNDFDFDALMAHVLSNERNMYFETKIANSRYWSTKVKSEFEFIEIHVHNDEDLPRIVFKMKWKEEGASDGPSNYFFLNY